MIIDIFYEGTSERNWPALQKAGFIWAIKLGLTRIEMGFLVLK